MAPGKEAVEFNKIIQADREKKKNQDIANKIFGRRSSAPAAGSFGVKKSNPGPSALSGRGGITKPSKVSNKAAKPITAAGRLQNNQNVLKRSVSTPQLNINRRHQALVAVANGSGARAQEIRKQANVRDSSIPRSGTNTPRGGFSIKGASQPRQYVVVAQNFAPGTTAGDIGSVFAPDPEAAGLISCKLIVTSPTVIAELIFTDQNTAETVVKTYNNQKADNRVLHVYHSDAPSQPAERSAPRGRDIASRVGGAVGLSSDESMEVDEGRPRYQQPYTPPQHRAQAEVQDGRYGFDDDQYRPHYSNNSDTGLVSDSMIQRSRSYGGGNRSYRR